MAQGRWTWQRAVNRSTTAVAHSAPQARTWLARRPVLNTESVILACSLFFTIACNGAFWRAVSESSPGNWQLLLAMFVLLTSLHAFVLGVLLPRPITRPLLTVLLLATALASHFSNQYGIQFDADMVRNLLHTDQKESREFLTPALVQPLLLAALGIVPLWQVRLRHHAWRKASLYRLAFLAIVATAGIGSVMLGARHLSPLLRNHREVRHLAAPVNYLVALYQVIRVDVHDRRGRKPRIPIGEDARLQARPDNARPRLLVLVVGETARAQNWGLNGYTRDTTPGLARSDVINFARFSACGTSTEVSLPCMFSPFGRHDYDEGKIREHQSLLHVLDRAGIDVLWRDNQSGCKGVCDGLQTQRLDGMNLPGLCQRGRCYDEILLDNLEPQLRIRPRDRIVVLHPLGNHGPAYFERYPPRFRHFTPACEDPDLGRCSRDAIVNAYDNALRYTDHLLTRTIALLQRQEAVYDTAMIYVSDHGESLGEKGLYLHGMPYAVAPREQLRVPMVAWFSPSFAAGHHLDLACVRRRAQTAADHDDLFSSVLGLFQVRSSVYDPARDLFGACTTATGSATVPDPQRGVRPHLQPAGGRTSLPATQPTETAREEAPLAAHRDHARQRPGVGRLPKGAGTGQR